MNEAIKIRFATICTLKNMNKSVVTNAEAYDYRFVLYLLNDVFDKETLARSAVYKANSKAGKFDQLDQTKLKFIEGI